MRCWVFFVLCSILSGCCSTPRIVITEVDRDICEFKSSDPIAHEHYTIRMKNIHDKIIKIAIESPHDRRMEIYGIRQKEFGNLRDDLFVVLLPLVKQGNKTILSFVKPNFREVYPPIGFIEPPQLLVDLRNNRARFWWCEQVSHSGQSSDAAWSIFPFRKLIYSVTGNKYKGELTMCWNIWEDGRFALGVNERETGESGLIYFDDDDKTIRQEDATDG